MMAGRMKSIEDWKVSGGGGCIIISLSFLSQDFVRTSCVWWLLCCAAFGDFLNDGFVLRVFESKWSLKVGGWVVLSGKHKFKSLH